MKHGQRRSVKENSKGTAAGKSQGAIPVGSLEDVFPVVTAEQLACRTRATGMLN